MSKKDFGNQSEHSFYYKFFSIGLYSLLYTFLPNTEVTQKHPRKYLIGGIISQLERHIAKCQLNLGF